MNKDWNRLITEDWSLFLDRDGVINRQIIDGYVTRWEEFEFLPGVMEAMRIFAQRFRYILVITNQQGVGKGLMTLDKVNEIHHTMQAKVEENGGRIDAALFCPQLATDAYNYRKPRPLMAYQAVGLFPDIKLQKCVMVGDKPTDIQFGRSAGTYTVAVGTPNPDADDSFNTLLDFAKILIP